MTLPFNVIGRVPVLAVPSGRTSTGLPTGVQLVGRTYDDVDRLPARVRPSSRRWASGPTRPGGPGCDGGRLMIWFVVRKLLGMVITLVHHVVPGVRVAVCRAG